MMPSLFEMGTEKEGDGAASSRLEEGGEASTASGGASGANSPENKDKKAKGAGPFVQPKSHSIDTIVVTFPLPAEDPLIHQRKAAELAKALGTMTFFMDRMRKGRWMVDEGLWSRRLC